MLKKDVGFKKRLIAAAALIAIRFILAQSQMIYIIPGSAPIDDDLYFKWANSIVQGEWLGRYNYLTLSKYPAFAVYLAALHKLGIPYLTGNCLLWTVVCGACVWAFKPVIRTNKGALAFFVFMLFNPYSFNSTNLRVYRDSLFFMMCILFFAGMAGWALRLKKDVKNNLLFLVIAGIGFAVAWTGREDGYWLLPFFVAAVTICAVYIFIDKNLENKILRVAAAFIPAAITFAAVTVVCSLNYKYYGVYTISDFNGGSFAKCFGAMTRLPHENWHPMVSVPEDVREDIYRNCPTLAPFEDYLEGEDSGIRKGYMSGEVKDYKSGRLYWAIRRAAQEMGIYESRRKAEDFWRQAAREVEALCRQYDNSLPPRKSLTPPIKAEYIAPVIETGLDSILYVCSWKDMVPYEASLSDVTTGQIEKWESFLYEKSNYSAIEWTFTPYHSPFQSFCYKIMAAVVWLYRLLTLVLMPLALFAVIKGFVQFKKRSRQQQILLFILTGLLAMAVFRLFIIAYMDVAAFGLGHYAMYLAVAYPVLTAVCGIAPVLLVKSE